MRLMTRTGTLLLIGSVFYCLGPAFLFAQAETDLYRYGMALNGFEEKKLYERTVEVYTDFLAAFTQSGHAPEIQYALARLHDDRKANDRAFVSYLKTVALYPESDFVSESKTRAGAAVSSDSKLSPIKEKLFSMLEMPVTGEDFASTYFNLIGSLRELVYPKLNDALIPECRLFMRTFPDHEKNPVVAEWMGDMEGENGNHWGALASYASIVYLYGSSDRVMASKLKMANLFADDLKRYEEAVGMYEEILADTPDSTHNGEILWRLALVLDEKLDNHSRAVQEYQNLVDRFPMSEHGVESLMKKAELHVNRLKQYEAGVKSYRQIVDRYPEDPRAAEALGLAADVYDKKMKDYRNAVQVYVEIAAKYPDHEDAAELLFKAAEIAEKRMNDTGIALELYQRVVDDYGTEKIAERARKKVESLSQNSG